MTLMKDFRELGWQITSLQRKAGAAGDGDMRQLEQPFTAVPATHAKKGVGSDEQYQRSL